MCYAVTWQALFEDVAAQSIDRKSAHPLLWIRSHLICEVDSGGCRLESDRAVGVRSCNQVDGFTKCVETDFQTDRHPHDRMLQTSDEQWVVCVHAGVTHFFADQANRASDLLPTVGVLAGENLVRSLEMYARI